MLPQVRVVPAGLGLHPTSRTDAWAPTICLVEFVLTAYLYEADTDNPLKNLIPRTTQVKAQQNEIARIDLSLVELTDIPES